MIYKKRTFWSIYGTVLTDLHFNVQTPCYAVNRLVLQQLLYASKIFWNGRNREAGISKGIKQWNSGMCRGLLNCCAVSLQNYFLIVYLLQFDISNQIKSNQIKSRAGNWKQIGWTLFAWVELVDIFQKEELFVLI